MENATSFHILKNTAESVLIIWKFECKKQVMYDSKPHNDILENGELLNNGAMMDEDGKEAIAKVNNVELINEDGVMAWPRTLR